MGCKQKITTAIVHPKLLRQDEVKAAAVAWAEYLYEEYCLKKQKRLISTKNGTTMKELTNHDKPNSNVF